MFPIYFIDPFFFFLFFYRILCNIKKENYIPMKIEHMTPLNLTIPTKMKDRLMEIAEKKSKEEGNRITITQLVRKAIFKCYMEEKTKNKA